MSDGTDYEVFENEAIDGRVFLQFLSGEVTNQFKLECLAKICTVRGRMKFSRGTSTRYENYEFSLEQAKSFEIEPMKSPEDMARVPDYLVAEKATVLKATEFPYHVPVESVTLLFINGNMLIRSDIPGRDATKNVTIMKADIVFRRLELITRPAVLSSYTLDEVVYDKITLLRGRLTLPRPHSFSMDVYLGTSSPFASRSRSFSPSTFRAVSASRSDGRRGEDSTTGRIRRWDWRRNWTRLSCSRLSVEFFIFFLVLLLWLIFRSSFLTEENYHAFTAYSIVFVILAAAAIFSFRGYTLKLFARLLSPVESNGRSFFVNGWNAWSFCGCVLQGQPAPMYSMPSMFVRAFHDGGVGASLRINLGQGEGPALGRNQTGGAQLGDTAEYREATRDFVASDMFTVVADTRVGYGVVLGFLSQRQQYGCIAVNRAYDRVSVHLSGDGTVVPSGGRVETDWLCLYTVSELCEPFKAYMALSSAENEVHQKLSCVRVPPSTQHQQQRSPTQVMAPVSALLTEHKTLTAADCELDEHFDPDADLCGKTADARPRLRSSHSTDGALEISPTTSLHVVPDALLGTHPHRRLGATMPAGWCSWYHFYEHISEAVLTSNLDFMQRFRRRHHLGSARQGFNLFQVDDGYQAAWGDWGLVNPAKFPTQSLFPLVLSIKDAGLTPGLWLAPFSADKHSVIARKNPSWVLKRNGSISVASNSANCGKFFYGLDTTHPEVQAHIRESIDVAKNVWGFEYLKLDFLYSAVLADAHDSHFDRTLTHAQIMQQALRLVTDTAGKDVFVLGCGAPLGSLIGHVHANRVSADAGLSWNPDFPLPSGDKWNLPCARNCVRNTLTRLFMHRQWWINDPDCMMLRDKLAFTDDEIRGIATSKALSGGSFIISDDLQMISPERFRVAQQLLPPARDAAVAVDLLERETPELFRMQLLSNYARWLLTEGGDLQGGELSPVSPDTSANSSYAQLSAATASTTALSLDMDAIQAQAGVWPRAPASCGPPSVSGTSSPQLMRQHSQDRGLIARVGSDLDLLKKERRRVREYLKTENSMNEEDLIGEFTSFTVCNWGEAASKNHFVSVRRVFGEEYVSHLAAKKTLLDNMIRLQLSRNASKGEKGDRSAPRSSSAHGTARAYGLLVSTGTPEKARSSLTASPRYLLHMFNFWTETYSSRVVSLDADETGEVAFLQVPRHSAHMYAVSLTTDPTLPKYIGSNLHFTCGSEVHRAFMTVTSPEAEAALGAVALARLADEHPDHAGGGGAFWGSELQEGGNDFAFGFGFGENMGSAEAGLSRKPSGGALPSLGKHAPVVRSMSISFEEGALRDPDWGGCIWVYLPVNGLNPLMTARSVGKIHITGPAWTSCFTASAQWEGDLGQPSAHLSPADESASFLPRRTSISSDRAHARAHQGHAAVLVSRVAAAECKIYGDVYRISVSCTPQSEASRAGGAIPHAGLAANGRMPGAADAYSCSVSGTAFPDAASAACNGSFAGSDYLTISWVYDLK